MSSRDDYHPFPDEDRYPHYGSIEARKPPPFKLDKKSTVKIKRSREQGIKRNARERKETKVGERTIVVVSATGKKGTRYHLPSCVLVTRIQKVRRTTLGRAKKDGFLACTKCNPR